MKNLIYALAIITLFSCSTHEYLEQENPPKETPKELTFFEKVSLLENYELPENSVLDIVKLFSDKFSYNDDTRGENEELVFHIKDRMYIPIDLNTETRSSDKEKIPVYKVDIDRGNKHGYTLVSGDIRNPKIIVYIPDTAVTVSFYDENAIKAAEMMKKISLMSNMKKIQEFNKKKESLRTSAFDKINNIHTRSTVMTNIQLQELLADALNEAKIEQSEKTFPLTRTKWDQGNPYNCKLPQSCPNNPGGRYYTGCGVVAVAQAIAYYEPALTLYGTPVDWKNLKKSSYIRDEDDKKIKDQIGFLMKWIGEKGNARYECEATSTSNIIGNILPLAGMKCDGTSSWNWDKIKSSIDNKSLVHVTGKNKEGDGHAWIIDGYITTLFSNEQIPDKYVHNNFGWSGLSDGYYEIEDNVAFNTSNGDFSIRNITININKK